MSPFFFIPLGVGNAFSARYYSTCLALHAEESWLLIDCPHPIRKMMREASVAANLVLDIDRVSGVVLTHLHGDHVSGLEDFAYYCRYALNGRKAHILAHPDVSARLWQGHLSAGMEWSIPAPGKPAVQRPFEEFFDLQPLRDSQAVSIGPFAIECRRTIHSIPTTALRIRAAGRCLGCSADTSFDPGLLEWFTEADLIVHETGPGDVHTPYEKLAALPEVLRRRIRLIHYPDNFDELTSVMEPLRQGQLYEV